MRILIAVDGSTPSELAPDLPARIPSAPAASLQEGGRSVQSAVIRGRAATAIVEEARRFGADLVIVGSRGHGALEEMLLGSVSAEGVDHAPCPVLEIRTTHI